MRSWRHRDGRSLELYLLHVIEHGITEFTAAAAILGELGHPITDMAVLHYLDAVAPIAPRA